MLRCKAELVEGTGDIEIRKLDAAAAFACLHKSANGLNVMEANSAQVTADAFDGTAQKAPLDGGG